MKLETNTDSISKLTRMIAEESQNQFGKLLQKDWETKHATIRHANSAGINEGKPRKGRPKCVDVGVCLCSDSGAQIYGMRNSFLAQMKPAFRHGSASRKDLSDGFIVVKISGHRAPAEDNGGWESVLASMSGLADRSKKFEE